MSEKIADLTLYDSAEVVVSRLPLIVDFIAFLVPMICNLLVDIGTLYPN